jgi:proteic killer suppression protein
MIKSFANQETEEIYNGIRTHAIRKLLPAHLLKVAQRKMDILNCIDSFEHLATWFPAEKGEAAVRDAHGKYSLAIDGNWRIAFRWDIKDALDVEIKS